MPTAADVVQAYFSGSELVEGVEMALLDEGAIRRFPICVCHAEEGGPLADQVISDLQARLPPTETGPAGPFGDQYPQFRKVFIYCTRSKP